ncbi:MAG: TrkA family potassium uptake protein [Methylococcales bacterium]|nr:TrkA family potassium uptake protein [Methylococcales bacterium]
MNRIIIFGYNHLSFDAATILDKNTNDILVVESDPALAQRAKDEGFKVTSIDLHRDDELTSIGIGQGIHVIFCFLSTDSENVFLILSARGLDQKLNIVTIAKSTQSAEKLIAAGANKIIDPYQLSGQKIYDLIKNPEITQLIYQTVFGRHDLNAAEITIPEDSSLVGCYTRDFTLNEKHNVTILGIVYTEQGSDLHFILGEKDHKFCAGDIIVVLGPSREIKAFTEDVLNV